MKIHGKRKVYDLGKVDLVVETNHFSAFGVDFKSPIPYRQEVVTKLSSFWFDFTKDLIPNYVISKNPSYLPEFMENHVFFNDFIVVKKTEEIPISCKVWNYLTGYAFKSYRSSGTVCGNQLPKGLRENQKLPKPICVFRIKGTDEYISAEDAANRIGTDLVNSMQSATLKLFEKCSAFLANKDILLYSTYFEFGIDKKDNLLLIGTPLNPENTHFDVVDLPRTLYFWDNQYIKKFFYGKSCNENLMSAELPHVESNLLSATYVNAYELITDNDFFDYDE